MRSNKLERLYYLIELYCDIWRIILTLSNHPGRLFVVVLPKHLARKVRWMNSGLSNRGMILRNFRANQFNLNSIYISLVENTITFHSLFTFSPFTHTIDCMLNYAHPHPGTCECTCILYCNQHNCNMNYIIIRATVAEEEITFLLRVKSNF